MDIAQLRAIEAGQGAVAAYLSYYGIGDRTIRSHVLGLLARYPEPVMRSQLARAQERIEQIIPGNRLRALALPMGHYPARLDWAIRGRAEGGSFEHDAILMVGGGPAPSPFSRRFDPYRLPRIQAVGSAVAEWIRYFDRHPAERFVSDGDPDTVAVPKGRLDEARSRAGQKPRIIDGETAR